MSIEIKFDGSGLIPAILQCKETGKVLMMAWMNMETLQLTRQTGFAHFWSRSRKKIWKKGEESGNTQAVEEVLYDCDADVLLLKVNPAGPACHTGEQSCFFRTLEKDETVTAETEIETGSVLDRLYQLLQDRKRSGDENSYVASLYKKGSSAYLKKIGEEAVELVIGCKNDDREEIIYEAADLWFHSMVAMAAHDVSPADILNELKKRFK